MFQLHGLHAALAAEHEDDPEADERAEREMVQHGLTVSSAQLPNAPLLKPRKPSIFVASSIDLLGRHGPTSPVSAPPAPGGLRARSDFSFLKRRQFELGGRGSAADADDPPCQTLRTALILPFCFFPDVERDPPPALAAALLERSVHGVPLWERCGLPHDVSELSSQFKQLLGAYGPETSPVQRLRVTDTARALLFSEARLWADTKTGDFAGKRCEWTDIHVIIFPHGAIASVTFDWMPCGDGDGGSGHAFTLSDLRNWIYVAKYRSIKGYIRKKTIVSRSDFHITSWSDSRMVVCSALAALGRRGDAGAGKGRVGNQAVCCPVWGQLRVAGLNCKLAGENALGLFDGHSTAHFAV